MLCRHHMLLQRPRTEAKKVAVTRSASVVRWRSWISRHRNDLCHEMRICLMRQLAGHSIPVLLAVSVALSPALNSTKIASTLARRQSALSSAANVTATSSRPTVATTDGNHLTERKLVHWSLEQLHPLAIAVIAIATLSLRPTTQPQFGDPTIGIDPLNLPQATL